MSKMMKSLVIEKPGQPVWTDLPIPKPVKGEVLIRVEGVTTCPHWDMHILDGVPMFPGMTLKYPYFPGAPGHEAMGEVVGVGKGVKKLKKGMKVVAWQDTGQPRPGFYAQYNTFPERSLLQIPARLTPIEIASLELAMCVEVSFQQLAQLGGIKGRRVGISGLGPAGLLAVQLAKAHGASEVVGIDMVESRRRIARKLGADHTVSPNAKTWKADRNGAKTLDDAIDCTGFPASIEFLMDRTKRCVTIFGVLRENVTYAARNMWGPGVALMGYGDHNRKAAKTALKFVLAGKLDLTPLVSKTLPFTRYQEGVALLKNKTAIKILFDPWAE